MSNYDKALSLENSALNSNGKAMEKYSIYQDSIAAKQERIVALAQTWVQNMNIEWAVGKLLSLAEALMKVFSNEVAANILKVTAATIAFVKGLKAVNAIVKGFGVYKKYGLLSLLFSANAIPLIAGIVAGITVLVAIIDKLHKSTAELRSDLQGINGDISSTESTLESYNEQIQANIDKIAELQALIDKGTGGIVEQEEIDNLKKSNKELGTKVQLEERRLELQKQQKAENLKEQYSRGFTLGQYGAARSITGKVMSMGTKTYSPEEIIGAYQEQIAKQQELYENAVRQNWTDMADAYSEKAVELESELVNDVIPVLQEMADTGMFPDLTVEIDKYLDSIKTYEEKFAEVLDDSQYSEGVTQFSELVQQNLEAVGEYLSGDDNALNVFSDMITEDANPAIAAMIAALQALGIPITEIIRYFYNAASAGETFSDSIQLETAASQITKFKDKVSAVVAAEEELTSTGYVSADAAEKLAEVFGDDVYDAMVWSEKGYKISKASLEELIEKQKEEYYLALNKAQDAAQAVVSANVDETASYKEKTVAILEALNAKKKELQLAMTSEVSGTSSYIQGRIISRKYAAQLSELEGIEDELLTAQKNLDTLDSTLSYLRRSSASTSSSSSSKSDAETAYERQNRLLEQALYLSQQIAEVYKDTDEAKYREEINKQLKIYNRLMDEAHKEAERYRKLGYTDESKEIQELQKAWWGYYNDRKDLQDGLSDWEKQNAEDTKQAVEDALSEVKDAIDDLLDDAEDALNDKLDALEARVKKNEAIRDLYEAFFGVLNDVADGMHEIDKELQASMDSADYLDEKLRQAMYNEDDYKKMSSKLNQIAEESRAMFEDYLSQLEMLTEDEIYKADYITNEFNRQYEYKKLEYDIAEKELELAKAQTKLQNTLMNRNVRMYKNGEWIWTADHSAVEEAKKEVADAEYEYRNAEIKRKQQEIIDKYEGIIDDLGLQKDAAEAEFDALKDMWENIQKQLTTEEDAMTRLLKAINGTDIPEFKSIINNVGVALETLIYNLTGIGSSFGGYGGGTGGFSYGGGTIGTGGTGGGSGSYDTSTAGGSASGWVLADGSKANLSFKDTTPYGKGTSASIKGADMSRDMKWAGQTVQKNGWAITYDEDGYAKSAINVRAGAAGENLANKYPRVDADGNLMYNSNDNSTLTGREYYYSTKSDVDDSRTWDKSNPNYTGGSSSSKDKDGSYTATSSSGSNYTIGSEKGKNFVESAKAGSTMTGGDGSKWTKNSDGSTTIEKNGKTYTVHDGGGILRGMGGIKATTADEAIFPPSITSKLLSPQKSREFLDSANAITKMLDNSSAISAMTSRFAGVVSGRSATTNDSHDLYLNGNPLGSMTKADSMALATILRRYIPVNGGGR